MDGPDLARSTIRMDNPRTPPRYPDRLTHPGTRRLLADSPEPGQPSAVRHHVADEGELVAFTCGCLYAWA